MRGDLEGNTTAWCKVLFAVWFLHREAPHSAPNTQLPNQSLQEFSAGSYQLSFCYLLHSCRYNSPGMMLEVMLRSEKGPSITGPFSSPYPFAVQLLLQCKKQLSEPSLRVQTSTSHLQTGNTCYSLHSATSHETLGVSTHSETEMSNYSSLYVQELFPDFN